MAFVSTRNTLPIGRRGRRFGVRDRGFGAVSPCPSLEQLQGIVDLSDPCQQSISAAGDTVVPPLDTGSASIVSAGALGPSFLGVPLPYAVLGGVVISLLLISSSGGRRR